MTCRVAKYYLEQGTFHLSNHLLQPRPRPTYMSSASFVHGGYPPLGPEPLPDTPGNEDLEVEFAPYTSEAQLPEMVSLIEKELRYVRL